MANFLFDKSSLTEAFDSLNGYFYGLLHYIAYVKKL